MQRYGVVVSNRETSEKKNANKCVFMCFSERRNDSPEVNCETSEKKMKKNQKKFCFFSQIAHVRHNTSILLVSALT